MGKKPKTRGRRSRIYSFGRLTQGIENLKKAWGCIESVSKTDWGCSLVDGVLV